MVVLVVLIKQLPRGSSTIIRRQAVISNSVLRRMDREFSKGFRTGCCLPCMNIHDVTAKLGGTMKSSGKSLLVMIHIGTNNSIIWNYTDH